MPNRCCALAIALLLGAACTASAASSRSARSANTGYAISVWETDDGLPQNSVITMTQTRDGYLWLGTLNGLVRFDGLRFTVYDENNTPELGSSRIVSLFEDHAGNLWVGTQTAGVVLVKEGQVTRLPIGQGGAERGLVAVCEDPQGAVWLYTANGELWRCEAGHYQPFLIDQGRPRALIVEPGGPVWVGTDRSQSAIGPTADASSLDLPVEQNVPVGRLDFLLASRGGGYWRLADGQVQKWRTNQLERDVGPCPWDTRLTPVTAACEDLEGNLLVGTRGAGVFWFDSEGQATCLSTNEGLSHNLVLSLQVDREGTLWVGTDGGGLNRVKRQVFAVLEDSRNQVVQSLSEDERGGRWIGFNTVEFNASGAAYLRNGALQRFGPAQGLTNSSVWAVFVDRSQQVWAGTYGGLYQLRDGGFQRLAGLPQVVPAIHQDRQGQLWFGTSEGLLRREGRGWKIFTARDGLSTNEVRAIADDLDGNLWVGTRGGGLNCLRDGRFTSFRKSPNGLPSDNVSALHVDSDGVLWVATDGGGLARLREGRWTRCTTREGLVSNSLGYLLEDGAGYLWIGSNAGLMRVAKAALNAALNDLADGRITSVPCRPYGKPDGLPTRECTSGSQPGAVRSHDGTLWFPTIKGLASVKPAQLHANTNPPPVLIEAVLVDDQPLSPLGLRAKAPESLTIPARRERLEIQYTSLNLGAPDRARFRYRLEPHELAWVEAGNTRVVGYPKLPPGDYRFQVTACNEDGVWNTAGSSLAISVLPPFWQTGWFLTASGVLLLGAIIGSVHYVSTQRLKRQVERMRQQEALEQERGRIARDLHDQLGASLTQIALLGELAESDKDAPAEVETHAQQISKTARETTRVLDEIVWTVNPSNDTLEGLVNYVCKYAQDYLAVAGLRYRLEVPTQLPATPLPPEVRHNVFLAAKEALTNVVRHAQATEVRIRLRLAPVAFTLEIEDNGRGVAGLDEPRPQTRNGLRNMRRRMEDLGGSFSIGPATDGGAVVCLTVPLDHRRTSLN